LQRTLRFSLVVGGVTSMENSMHKEHKVSFLQTLLAIPPEGIIYMSPVRSRTLSPSIHTPMACPFAVSGYNKRDERSYTITQLVLPFG
jgi:hypothetical protein